LGQLANLELSIKPKAKMNIRAYIVDFSVETDSVVATVTIQTNDTLKRILIDWGDDSETLNSRPGIYLSLPGTEPLPPGTYRFSHAYAEPEDRRPFLEIILVRVEDNAGGLDFRVQDITLTPRYRVTNYRTSVRTTSRCDLTGLVNDFTITQLVDGEPVNEWDWTPSNTFWCSECFHRLEDSIVSRELTLADGIVNVGLDLIEHDPAWSEHLYFNQRLRASQNTEHIERSSSSGGCTVIARWDRDVTLIVPLPRRHPTFQASI
jgi:hypothetical protein